MAVRLDAAADRLSYSAAAPPAVFTITGWVYLSVDRDDYSAIGRLWTGALSTVVTWSTDGDGTSGPWAYTGGGSIGSSTGLAVGEWRRVAITRTGSSGQILTATPTGSTEVDSGAVGTATPAGITLGGRDTGDPNEWLNGRLAYVRIWDSVLSQAEIEAEWASATPVRTSGLWADWPLSSATDLTDTVAGRTLAVASGGSLTTEDGPDLGGGDTTGVIAGSLPGPTGALHEVQEFLAGYLVGGRNLRPSGLVTDSGGTYRLKQTARIPVSGLQLTFAGWYTGPAGTGDTDCPNDYTIHSCYLEHDGSLNQVLFDGSGSVTVAPGEDVHGTVTRAIAAGEDYYIRTYVTPAASGSYPRLYAVGVYPDESCAKGADHANETGTTNLINYGDVVGPVAVTGTPTGGPRYAVAVVGDSITNGSNDTFGDYDRVGWAYRALNGQRPFLLLAISGEQAAQYLSQGAHRQRYVGPGAHYAICAYGVNDLQGGRTLAQAQAALLGIWSAAAAANPAIRVLQTTITPKSSSTDGWATTGSQTPDGTVTPVRTPLNAWIRAGAPIVSGVAVTPGTSGALLAGQPGHPLWDWLELADLVEPTPDAGIWRAGYTDDGVHPTATGHIAMAAGLQLSQLPDLGSGQITGSLPTPTGTLTGGTPLVAGAVSGNLPSVGGALASGLSAAGQLAGQTPAPAGALAGTLRSPGAMDGSLPTPTGALAGGVRTSGSLAGQLPTPQGELYGPIPLAGALTGQMPSPAGQLAAALRTAGILTGHLPGLVGAIGMQRVDYPVRAGAIVDLALRYRASTPAKGG